jgi:hypothetical protein
MSEINPYESPSSTLLAPDNSKKAGILKNTLISVFTFILLLLLFWLPGKLVRTFHWHSLEKQGDLGFWNYQALLLLSINDFVTAYYWLLFPFVLPIIFAARYVQNHSKRMWLVAAAFGIYAINLFQAVTQAEQYLYFKIAGVVLCLYALVLGPTIIFSWWLFDRNGNFVKNGNNLLTLVILSALGMLLSEGSLWAAWRNHS